MSLRTRLTLITVVTLLLSLLAFAGLAGAVLWRVEVGSISRQVSAQADALMTVAQAAQSATGSSAFASTPSFARTATDLLEVNGMTGVARVYDSGQLRWAGGAAGPDTLDTAFLSDQQQETAQETTRTSGDYMVSSRRAGHLSVQVGRNLEPLENLLRRYALIALLTLLLLSAAMGWIVAGQVRAALAPLEKLAGRVQHLDSQAPIPALSEPDEVGALARALDRSLGALHAERERETLFLASASHELRTPVTAMLADVQHTLSRPRSPEDLQAALERTERTASRLRSLTGNLMTLSRAQRLEAPSPPTQPAELDLLELAGEAVDLLQPLAMKRDIDLWLDGQSAPVRGEATLLTAVLENLIGNAIKFTAAGTEVRVRVLALPGGGAELSVQDAGPGFGGEVLTGAFERGPTQAEGFGLGLAVVKQVVDAYGGTLHFGRSVLGGAEVVVWLP